jgi:polyisoprenoid-binding protein YceI
MTTSPRYLFFLTALAAIPVRAGETVIEFNPPQTRVAWTLDTVLHTVHGTFQLRRGTIHFDPETGKAGGEIVVDARSGQSGNDSRDSRMHKTFLESTIYPDVVFTPDRVDGRVPSQGAATVQVHGTFALHGTRHELTLPIQLNAEPGRITADTHFIVPYVSWGLKNPSTFILHVDDKLDIEIHSTANLVSQGASPHD